MVRRSRPSELAVTPSLIICSAGAVSSATIHALAPFFGEWLRDAKAGLVLILKRAVAMHQTHRARSADVGRVAGALSTIARKASRMAWEPRWAPLQMSYVSRCVSSGGGEELSPADTTECSSGAARTGRHALEAARRGGAQRGRLPGHVHLVGPG